MSSRSVIGTALVAAVTAALLPGAASAAAGRVTVVPTNAARFPDRSYVVRLPGSRSLTSSSVVVTENGRRVSGVSLLPADAARPGQFGAVLVIDASESMRGHAIAAAVAAGRAFVAERNPNESVAVVAFNRSAWAVQPFTTDQAKLVAALSRAPALATGTHIYDGVALAVRLIEQARIASGSVVVLSDGADTGSTTSAAATVAAARAHRVRLFTVGLRAHQFRPGPLRALARGTDGRFAEASSPDVLERIYAELSAQFASEYMLRYRSLAGPKQHVDVSIRVRGFPAATSDYTTPPLGVGNAPVFHRPVAVTFWLSQLSTVATMVLVAGLAATAFALLVRPRRRSLRKRMAEFVSLPVEERGDQQKTLLADRVLDGAERSLERARWWGRFKEDLELAEVQIPAIQIVAATAVATVVAAWILAAALGSVLFGAIALAIPFTVRSLLHRKLEGKRKAFADQLPDNLQVLASALRAGHSFVAALSVVVADAPEPSRSEFGRVVSEERLGVGLEQALGVVVRRMANRDLEQVALVAALQHETGGNTAEVLDRVTDTIRERYELRRMVKTLTAQGRMSRWVVSFLPLVLLALVTLLNPRYMEPLFTHTLGRVLLAVAALMVVAGSLVIKRIVDIKV